MRKLDRLYLELETARTRLRAALLTQEQQDRAAFGSDADRTWFATRVRLQGRILGVDTAVRYLDPYSLPAAGPWRRKAHAALGEAFRSLLTREQPRDALEAEIRAFQSEGIGDAIAAIGAGIEGNQRPLQALHELNERPVRAKQRQRDRSRGD